MAEFRDYKRYTTDPRWAAIYIDYQKKYAANARESDKRSAQLVKAASERMRMDRPARILDIGCSTGNFLRHLRAVLPTAELTGGDLMVPHLDECRKDQALKGIQFEEMDILEIPKGRFDIIVANAVSVYFDNHDYERAAKSIAAALPIGGVFVAFELIFPGDKSRRIIEPSDAHPEGLKVELRAKSFVQSAFEQAGMHDFDHVPWEMPIDLPKPIANGTDADLISWTELDETTNRRLLWRGIDPKTRWYQPWSHIVTRKCSSRG